MLIRAVLKLLLIALLPLPSLVVATDVYRWTDPDGGVYFGNRPPAEATLMFRTPAAAAATPVTSERRRVHVSRVIDGDTVQLTIGQRVRLVGINAPEVAVAGKPGQRGGENAKSRLAGLVEGQTLGLEYAEERVDRYGRMLGYLFDTQGQGIAEQLLREGLVFVAVYPPNLKYIADYMAAEAVAREAGIGLWALPDYRVFTPAELTDARNLFRRVRFVVSGLEEDGKDLVLRDRAGFQVRIPPESAGLFGPVSQLLSRTLVVRGFIHSRRGAPYLLLQDPSQIESRE